MKNKISKEWLTWIDLNLKRGIKKTYIFNTLIEHGHSYSSVKKTMNFEPKVEQVIPENWKKWLQHNISLGHNKDSLFKVLLINGFSFDAIREEMQYKPSVSLDSLHYPFDYSKFQKEQITANASKMIKNSSSKNLIKIASDKLDIFYVESFLTKMECDHLVELIKSKLRPSGLTTPDNDHFFRTSKTCDLASLNDKTVENIDKRICELVHAKPELSEPLQGQFYEIGQEFKPHTDFFEKSEIKENGGSLGQRSLTVMIYLNTTEVGGETSFPLINTEFSPRQGKAIIWSNLKSDYSTNQFSLHHAKKVRKGFKAVITKWFRTGALYLKLYCSFAMGSFGECNQDLHLCICNAHQKMNVFRVWH